MLTIGWFVASLLIFVLFHFGSWQAANSIRSVWPINQAISNRATNQFLKNTTGTTNGWTRYPWECQVAGFRAFWRQWHLNGTNSSQKWLIGKPTRNPYNWWLNWDNVSCRCSHQPSEFCVLFRVCLCVFFVHGRQYETLERCIHLLTTRSNHIAHADDKQRTCKGVWPWLNCSKFNFATHWCFHTFWDDIIFCEPAHLAYVLMF